MIFSSTVSSCPFTVAAKYQVVWLLCRQRSIYSQPSVSIRRQPPSGVFRLSKFVYSTSALWQAAFTERVMSDMTGPLGIYASGIFRAVSGCSEWSACQIKRRGRLINESRCITSIDRRENTKRLWQSGDDRLHTERTGRFYEQMKGLSTPAIEGIFVSWIAEMLIFSESRMNNLWVKWTVGRRVDSVTVACKYI